MQYVEMSIEEALKIFKGDVSKTVLVAVKDLEKDDDIQSFEKVGISRCKRIIKSSSTIIGIDDDFDLLKQLLLYSSKQNIQSIKPIGTMTRIVYKE